MKSDEPSVDMAGPWIKLSERISRQSDGKKNKRLQSILNKEEGERRRVTKMWIIINLNKDPFGEEDVVGFKHILRKNVLQDNHHDADKRLADRAGLNVNWLCDLKGHRPPVNMKEKSNSCTACPL